LWRQDGSLIFNKWKLLSLAREKVHSDGYNYSKKASRSQVFGSEDGKKKRKYVHQDVRQAQKKNLLKIFYARRRLLIFCNNRRLSIAIQKSF
jgi:hypothetical protein